MTVIVRNNDHNMRQQISAALTALESDVATLEANAVTYAYKSADQTAIGATFADVTDTGLAVVANGVYEFEFQLIADVDANTTGIDVACNGPASPTAVYYTQTYWDSIGPRLLNAAAVAYDNNTASATSLGTVKGIYVVRGILVNGANAGTLIARIKREAVGSGPNVRAGSFGRLHRLG